MAAAESDFNPGFSFDFGALAQPQQAAWEFKGALRDAKAEQAKATKTKMTSIDEKIQSRLKDKSDRKAAKAQASRKGAARRTQDREDEGSSEESDDDAPLPGELDDDSDGDSGSSGDLMDDSDGASDLPINGTVDSHDSDSDNEADNSESESEQMSEEGESESESDQSHSDDHSDHSIDSDADTDSDGEPGGSTKAKGANGAMANGHKAPNAKQQAAAKQPPAPAAQKGKGAAPAAAAAQQRAAANGVANGASHRGNGAGAGEGGDTDSEGVGGGYEDEATRRQQKGASTSGQGTRAAGAQQGGTGGFFAQAPDGTTFKAASFGDLNLSRPLTRACHALGYTTPTPIQAAVIPLALAGRDICGSAVTGSGKTAAFALPCLERLLHRQRQIAATYVLVLTPTRELAVQIHSMMTNLAQYTDISIALVVGGLSVSVQSSVLRRSPEVVVATPGRMIDHLRNTQSVGLEDLAVLILDEADRLLEMGFKDEIMEIVKMTPRKRQTMLFSATFNEEVRKLMSLSLKQPVRLAADAVAAVPKDLRQEVLRLKGAQAASKEAALLSLCARSFRSGHAIVFFRTKQRAHRAKILFGLLGLPAAAELHGDMTQAARLESLEQFRCGKAAFLLATDVAARGLDIPGVQVVLNYDAPRSLETYLHRIGRTARAGAAGVAVTFVEDGDRALLKEVVKKTKAVMTQRVVPPAAVSAWQARAEGATQDVYRVIAEEREERELRRAEMEATKMQNMIDHEDEIKSRPQRSWFQSERQKRDAQRRAAQEAAGQEAGDDSDGGADRDRAKAKAKQDAKNKKREKRKLEAAANEGANKRRDMLKEETGEYDRAIKSTKSKLRALQEQGISARQAQQIVAAQNAGVKGKSGKGKKKSGKQSGLFSGDGTGRSTEPTDGGSGGKGSDLKGHALRARTGLDKNQLNRVKRGGVGKSQFKSKAKYKRRK